MESPEEYKKRVINKFLTLIYKLSSKEYQIQTWVKCLGPEFDETEFFCQFLEQFPTTEGEQKKMGLTPEQMQLFQNVMQAFKDFDKSPSADDCAGDFIESPEWARVMEEADKAVKAFNFDAYTSAIPPMPRETPLKKPVC